MSSIAYNAAGGLGGMLKDGHKHIWDGAVMRNLNASIELSSMLQSSLGPMGRHKLVVNHLQKLIVTSDCATILRELEVEHPAAKMLAMACQQQKQECGDGSNLVLAFGGALLQQTQQCMNEGLHVSEVIAGYQMAAKALWEELSQCSLPISSSSADDSLFLSVLEPVLASKQFGLYKELAPLVLQASKCVQDDSKKIAPERVRTVTVLGGAAHQSLMIAGYVAQRAVDSQVTEIPSNAKIAVFACGVEASTTEAKGTVLLKTADELQQYNKSEERKMEEIIASIAATGANVVVTGGTLSEMALHFLNRFHLLVLKIGSKWELRRLCQAVGATALVRLGPPTPDELGHCRRVHQTRMGAKTLTLFENDARSTKLATIILRASTLSVLQDLERAVRDGVHALAQFEKNPRLVPGAGATEFHLSRKINHLAQTSPGLDQYALFAFSKALAAVPKILAETAGYDGPQAMADLLQAYTSNQQEKEGFPSTAMGICLESFVEGTTNNGSIVGPTKVVDVLATKKSALQLALDAALTILRVDQIIMSKQAGVKPQ